MEIKRDTINSLNKDIDESYVTILVGSRQVGKTFLLRKIADFAKARGLKTAFFDLEQPDVLNRFNKKDAEIVKFIMSAGDVVFLDEFHYLKNASRIFKAIYDSGKKIKIFASGSSSLEIHKHLKESLAGRKMIYRIYPCSFGEISQVISGDPLDYYFKYGGLPGLIHIKDAEKRKKLLLDILQSYILKDIKSLIKEENIRAFNNLLYLLAQYQGAVVTVASLANEVGLTAKSIEAYLEILSQTYINFPLHSFSRNYGNELKKSKKYYLYDLGIRNVLLKNFSALTEREDKGIMAESFVFSELNFQLTPETELRFWRLKDGTEIDFIWVKNQKPFPIEVKTKCGKGEIPGGLKGFINRYPKTEKAFILNKNYRGSTSYKDTPIFYRKWTDATSIPAEV
ncbi:MAG: ATP-binding protein [Candidatus Margulisiibacteriota bacterium]|nr:ATP-binding protein [Candidatus Margulisiibacteriota bacterium]